MNKRSYALTTKNGTNFEYLDRVYLWGAIANIIYDSVYDSDEFDVESVVLKIKNLLHV